MKRSFLSCCLIALILSIGSTLPLEAAAQRSKDGPSLVWDKQITVIPNTMIYGDSSLQAFTFTVFETDPKSLLEQWRADHAARSLSITKGEPAIANDARIEELAPEPVTILATTRGDKKAGNASMTIAVRSKSEIPQAKLEKYARDLAVKYNRRVVEQQIRLEEKKFEEARADVSKSISKDEKLKAKLQKTNADLNKLEAARTKQQSKNASIQEDVVAAQARYDRTKEVKDLKRLTKLRQKLSSGETKVARYMEKEARLHSTATKHSGNMPASERSKQGNIAEASGHEERIQALRTKLSDIR